MEETISRELDGIGGGEVLVVGDCMLDIYIRGEVRRISPEAPVPVLKVKDEEISGGGACNVLRNLATLGVRCGIVGICGEDKEGSQLRGIVERIALLHLGMVSSSESKSIVKRRYVCDGQQMLRVDSEEDKELSNEERRRLLLSLKEGIGKISKERGIVVVSDYGKGVIDGKMMRDLIGMTRDAGLRVVVDPKSQDFSIYNGSYVVTPNRQESELVSGIRVVGDSEAKSAGEYIRESYEIENVLITRSSSGMSLVGNGILFHVPARAREVYDVGGAGDTVVAVLAAGLSVGIDIVTASRLANVAAAVVVAKTGTATASRQEIYAELHKGSETQRHNKVYDLGEILKVVDKWKDGGIKVGFTNGCFDLLHYGHVHFLQSCKDRCERLIVGLNSDNSIKKIKGECRPIRCIRERLEMLSALNFVDGIIIFEEETPLRLIEEIRPDILFKGSDYIGKEVVGSKEVELRGGSVELLELLSGYSTSEEIGKIRGIERK